MSSSANIGTVGSFITFSCSSDLDPVRIEWYRNNTLLSQRYTTSGSVTLGPISTDDEGAVFTCSAIGNYGSQERNKTLQVQGKLGILLRYTDNACFYHVCIIYSAGRLGYC